ncbi:phytoene/squalene synthase family protein [Salinisphaera sp. Q1T1-3]|uniref:phytoene/squalene synthase family protein n=1 Tax=Salinisphaera sp. Q1T1-3 TaxID=2321229 RepID=UPI000E74D91F|nr:phytoene/squalene synthase family protein [Salinisphaera sp. Q1T1-3]RJS92104.1 phytoene/squalene synthase family protein [Salinisphaera sp. Q1T1-3]
MSDTSPSSDLAACRRLLAEGSRSFDLAARGLPSGVRDDATALYAFCRVADDAIDRSTDPGAALNRLAERLDAIYADRPVNDPVDRATAALVRRHDLPRAVFDALLEGLGWDVAGREYRTLAELRAYAARVAGTVGVLMTLIMGRRDADTLTRAAELGVAMQLTNIARDVGEDAELGRCYLPRDWHPPAGDDVTPGGRPARWQRAATARLLREADRHYAHAMPGIARLPGRCRIGIRAAAYIYAEIGAVIAAADHDSVTRRAVVPRSRKLVLLAGALWPAARPTRSDAAAPAAAETAFLVDVACRSSPTADRPRPQTLRWWQLAEQWGWVIELFGRLAARERLDRLSAPTSNESSRSTTVTQQR